MKRFIACVTAMTLAFSLFGMPAMAAEPSSKEQESSGAKTPFALSAAKSDSGTAFNEDSDDSGVTNDSESGSSGGSDSSQASNSGASDEDASIDLSDEIGTIELPETEAPEQETPELEEEQPKSFLDMIIEFFTGGSRSAKAMTTASLAVSFTTQSPAAVKAMASDITMTLSPGNKTATFGLKPGSDSDYFADIEGINPGKYTLTITSKNHGTYVHEDLEFAAGDMLSFKLVDSMLSSALRGSNASDPNRNTGLLPYGDFDEDGKVDEKDAQKISDESATKSKGGVYDLNGDGTVDLSDIQMFASTMNKSMGVSKVRVTRDGNQMEVSVSDGTSMSATGTDDPDEAADSLFKDDGKIVTITPSENNLPDGNTYPISKDNPVEFAIDANNAHTNAIVIQSPTGEDGKVSNMPVEGTIKVVVNDNGEKVVVTFPITDTPTKSTDQADRFPKAECHYDEKLGQVVIDFGEKLDVDSLGLTVTKTSGPDTSKLDIEKIEFLNDGEDRVIPPTLHAPSNVKVESSNKKIDISWAAAENATGYQVQISLGEESQLLSASGTSLSIRKFGDADLENGTEYSLRVRTVNGTRTSAWSDTLVATPEFKEPPEAPDAPALTPGYSEVTVGWKAMDNADSYTVYYKAASDETYSKKDVESTSTVVTGLKRNTEYTFYLTAHNEFGESKPGKTASATTENVNVKVPWYYLINRTVQDATAHPISESISWVTIPGEGAEDNSSRVVDGNYDTFFEMPEGTTPYYDNGPTVAFNSTHKIDTFAITTYLGINYSASIQDIYVKINELTTLSMDNGITFDTVVTRDGSEELAYNTILVKLPEAYNVDQISVNFVRADGAPTTISELAFYDYCSFSSDIKALFKDDLHIELAEGVTVDTINELKEAVNTPDSFSETSANKAELHYNIDIYNAEIEAALSLLHAGDYDTIAIDPSIYAGDSEVNGVNAWQPLGVTVQANERIQVFVGSENGVAGEPTNLRLIATQYRGTADSYYSTIGTNLSTGMNSITIPDMGSSNEHGGALYVEYTSSEADTTYGIHVIGGSRIPVLDLHGITGETSSDIDTIRKERIATYVESLNKHVESLSSIHGSAGHKTGSILNTYNEQYCIANTTDIVTDYTMLSLPATQFKASIDELRPDTEDIIDELNRRLGASDKMMEILYQHKGLFDVDDEANADLVASYGVNNDIPRARQSIRYMQTPTGTMYASKNHIGVTWNGSKGLGLPEGVIDGGSSGRYKLGSYYDWDVLHEIGHQIMQPEYGIEEVTNNYYAQLLTNHDTNDTAGFSYSDVYDKVTSGVKAPLEDCTFATALYWQLHLAYDAGFSYKYYNTAADQMSNLVFARIDAYARNPEKAPYDLSLEGADQENAFMRLAMAATGKDNLAFFEAWGLTPDEDTIAYAANFTKETRAIQYVTDDSRRTAPTKPFTAGASVISEDALAEQNVDDPSRVDITGIGVNSSYNINDVLLFEISKKSGSSTTIVGYVGPDETTFTDYLTDSCTYSYSVCAIDKALTKSGSRTITKKNITGPATEALLAKESWTATSTMIDPKEELVPEESGSAQVCMYATPTAANSVIDDDYGTTFEGVMPEEELSEFANTAVEEKAKRTGDYPSVTIALNDVVDICGIVYTPGIHKDRAFKQLWVQTSLDGKNWQTVALKDITADMFGKSETLTVYFDRATALPGIGGTTSNTLHFQKASYVRLTEFGENDGPIAIAEIDVLTSVGDDISFLDEDSNYGIGVLNHDLTVKEETDDADAVVIPEGSLAFIGTFVGSPENSSVLLLDEDGYELTDDNGNTAKCEFVAPNLTGSEFTARASGVWICYFLPGTWENSINNLSQVYAGLYRIDSPEAQGTLVAATSMATIPYDVDSRITGIDVSL